MDLTAIEQWLNVDLNETNIRWGVAWVVAFLLTVWNGWDALLDLLAVYKLGRNGRIKTSAWWFFRQDLVKAVACLLMVIAGVRAILRMTGGTVTVDLLMWAAGLFALNQTWNRIDRWKVKAAIKRAAQRERQK